MLKFLELKQEAFGIDISDFSIKIAKLKKRSGFFDLACFNRVRIEQGIIRKGEIRKPDKMAEIIKKAVKEASGEKIKTKNAIISLPEEKAFLQVIKMPCLSKDDLKSAIIFEAENHIPLAIEEVYLDYEVISSPENDASHIDVLVVAFPRKTIDSYLACLKKADIEPIALETESLALSRALIKSEEADKPALLIDFGANRTIFIIFAAGSVKFVFSIPVSSFGFSELIARTMKIDLEKAEKLKMKYGLAEKVKLEIKDEQSKSIKKEEKGKVFEALVPALTDLIEQIRKYSHYYETHSGNKKIEKILISGGGAKLKGLDSFLSSELGTLVEIGNPWINIFPSKTQPEKQKLIYRKEESLEYANVLGLALRGIKE